MKLSKTQEMDVTLSRIRTFARHKNLSASQIHAIFDMGSAAYQILTSHNLKPFVIQAEDAIVKPSVTSTEKIAKATTNGVLRVARRIN